MHHKKTIALICLVLLSVTAWSQQTAAEALAAVKAAGRDDGKALTAIEQYLSSADRFLDSENATAESRKKLADVSMMSDAGRQVSVYLMKLNLRKDKLSTADQKLLRSVQEHSKSTSMKFWLLEQGKATPFPYRVTAKPSADIFSSKKHSAAEAEAQKERRLKWEAEKSVLKKKGLRPLAHEWQEAIEKPPANYSEAVSIYVAYVSTAKKALAAKRGDVYGYLTEARFLKFFYSNAKRTLSDYREDFDYNPKWRRKEMQLLGYVIEDISSMIKARDALKAQAQEARRRAVTPRRMSRVEIKETNSFLKLLSTLSENVSCLAPGV